MRTKPGVDAVGCDHDVGFGEGAAGERDPSDVPLLFKADATPSMYRAIGQRIG